MCDNAILCVRNLFVACAECQIPDKANVFYAVNRTMGEVKLVVRKKTELEKIKQKKRKEYFKKKAFVL